VNCEASFHPDRKESLVSVERTRNNQHEPRTTQNTAPPAPNKFLLVASTGGHLAQLTRLAPALGASDDSLWVTFDSPQSRSLLEGKRVLHVPYVRPRDFRGVVRTASILRRLLRRESFAQALSTGSAIALSALPLATLHGVPSTYVESVSRVDGPSMSGRILAATRLVAVRTQHPAWAKGRWAIHPSVFSTYRPLPTKPVAAPSLFVTLGTIEGYRFDAMVDAVLATGLADERTVWQLGFTTGRTDLPGTVHTAMTADDFVRSARAADVVISHAGVGSLLGLLDMGIFPVMVTRRKWRAEHVDDHQQQIARLASQMGVALSVEASDLSADVIRRAAETRIDSEALRPVGLPE
jgi:UDP-N-acetylglucosamine transferase subunit ALG13